MAVDLVDHHFGVGLGGEAVAGAFQLPAHGLVVLDDAVVDDGDLVAGDVGMGVFVGRAAVGGPAGVGDAGAAGDGRLLQGFGQLGHLARAADPMELAVVAEHGDAGGVVASVLQAPQAFQEDFHYVAFGDRAYDSTHSLVPVPSC